MIETDSWLGKPVSRRWMFGVAAELAVLWPIARASWELATPPDPIPSPERFGATISNRQAAFLGLDPRELFEAVLAAGFAPVRVIADWSEVEPDPGRFETAEVEWQLDRARATGTPVFLSFGAKTPRYPEFNAPPWVLAGLDERDSSDREAYLLEHTLAYNAAMIALAANDPTVEFLQPGNEDLEPSEVTQWRSLSEGFVRSVVAHTRSESNLPILLTCSLPLTFADFLFRALRGHLYDGIRYVEVADAVGLNTHTAIRNRVAGITTDFIPGPHYWPMVEWLRNRTWAAGGQAMITEVQAEPFDYTIGNEGWGERSNITPAATKALDERVVRMGFGTRLAWGVEFAYWRWKHGERRYWDGLVARVEATQGGRPANVRRGVGARG